MAIIKPPAESIFRRLIGWLKREEADCEIRPLIHTFLEFDVAQNVGFGQRGEKRNPTDRSGERAVRRHAEDIKLGIIEGCLTSSH